MLKTKTKKQNQRRCVMVNRVTTCENLKWGHTIVQCRLSSTCGTQFLRPSLPLSVRLKLVINDAVAINFTNWQFSESKRSPNRGSHILLINFCENTIWNCIGCGWRSWTLQVTNTSLIDGKWCLQFRDICNDEKKTIGKLEMLGAKENPHTSR